MIYKYSAYLISINHNHMEEIDIKSLPVRFSLVDPKKLIYRGGQPTKEHLQMLHDMGIKNIVNLRREDHIQRYRERKACESLNINYHPYPHYGIFGVDKQFINEVVDVIHNLDTPTYIHCKNGRDRTSLIVASYLVKYHKKDPELAWKENVLAYDHDENNILYSYFKQSFFDFCADIKEEIKNSYTPQDYEQSFENKKTTLEELLNEIYKQYGYRVWLQAELCDTTGVFKVIFPFTNILYKIAALCESDEKLAITSKTFYENNKVINLYGKTKLGTLYQIQFWPTIIYSYYEYKEHDELDSETQYMKFKEHDLQSYLDDNIIIK